MIKVRKFKSKMRLRAPFKEREFLSDPPKDLDCIFYDFRLKKIVKYNWNEEEEEFVRDMSWNYDDEIKKLPPNRMSTLLWELRDQARERHKENITTNAR